MHVEVRIGVTQSARELVIDIDSGNKGRDKLKSSIDAALSGATEVLWLTDKKGREVALPSAKIAYIELGSDDGDRRIGFGD